MLKHIILSLLMLTVIAHTGYGQSLSPSVIGSAGGVSDKEGRNLTSTTGETVTQTLSSDNRTLTQGFQQSYSDPGDGTNLISAKGPESLEVEVYPNPVRKELRLKGTGDNVGEFSILVYNMKGRKLEVPYKQTKASPHESIYKLNMEGLSAGVYMIRIKHFESNESFSAKVTKRQ